MVAIVGPCKQSASWQKVQGVELPKTRGFVPVKYLLALPPFPSSLPSLPFSCPFPLFLSFTFLMYTSLFIRNTERTKKIRKASNHQKAKRQWNHIPVPSPFPPFPLYSFWKVWGALRAPPTGPGAELRLQKNTHSRLSKRTPWQHLSVFYVQCKWLCEVFYMTIFFNIVKMH